MTEVAGRAVRSYRDLDVWRASMDLAVACYEITSTFPPEECFGLASQIRRAAVSIPANIAEGNGRETTNDYVRFLRIAQGSLKEVETHAILAERVSLSTEEQSASILEAADRIGRMLRGLIRSLQGVEQR